MEAQLIGKDGSKADVRLGEAVVVQSDVGPGRNLDRMRIRMQTVSLSEGCIQCLPAFSSSGTRFLSRVPVS